MYESFFEKNEGDFWVYLDSILHELREINTEYDNIINLFNRELDKSSNLRRIYEDEIEIVLGEKEIKSLIKILSLLTKKRRIELEEVFFIGGKNTYEYLKKIGALK